MNLLRALWTAVLLAPGIAHADEVLLVPEVVVDAGVSRAEAIGVYDLVVSTLRENGFVVIDGPSVARFGGDVMTACGRPPCVNDALMSVPSRVAMVVGVRRSRSGNPELMASFYVQGSTEAQSELVLPIEPGRERRVALQVALYALDVAEEVGPSSQAAIDAARRMTELSVEVVVIASEPQPPAAPPDPAPQPPVEVDPPPAVVEAPVEPVEAPPPAPTEVDPELEFDEPDVEPIPPPDVDLAPRLYTGSRGAYEAREGLAADWYRKQSPHAGRFIVQLRGGLAHSDINRSATSLLATDGAEVTAAAWLEGPVKGVGGRLEALIGYAPATMIDFGVLLGVDLARDTVALGYMREDEPAELGAPETFSSVRVGVQPRLRLFPVTLGAVKPYLLVGAEAGFIKTWSFEVTDAQPFPRPPGGTRWSVVGGAGFSLDPHPRVGILLEAAVHYHLGDVAKVRTNGVLVGESPAAPVGSGFAIVPIAGLEFRL